MSERKSFSTPQLQIMFQVWHCASSSSSNNLNEKNISSRQERRRIMYDKKKQRIIKNGKCEVLTQIEGLELREKSTIYPNQQTCAEEIIQGFCNTKVISIMVTALTQSGKTGAMLGLIREYLNNLNMPIIPIDNIYIITGLSSRDWKSQTSDRMPARIQERIYHRNDLCKKFVNNIKESKENILVIIDEVQIAAKENQTIYKVFEKAGFYNKENLLNNNIKIIEFSATPDGTIYDIMGWRENSIQLKMEPGDKYKSCFNLLDEGRVRQYKDLCGRDKKTKKINKELIKENITEIKTLVEKYQNPMYHIIRTPNGGEGDTVIQNFRNVLGQDIEILRYDGESQIEKINDILEKKPEKHKYIFIKEKLRCANTIYKKYLGILYDRYVKMVDDAVCNQGLIGRATGYDDNGKSVCFTNKSSIEKYKKLWDSNFKDKTVKWKSKTTSREGGELHSKKTFNSPEFVDGMNGTKSQIQNKKELIYNRFDSHEEVKKYYNDIMKPHFPNKRGPNTKKPKPDGFYHECIKKKTKKWSHKEIVEDKVFIGSSNNNYWYYACYTDINNKETLEFWFIHREF